MMQQSAPHLSESDAGIFFASFSMIRATAYAKKGNDGMNRFFSLPLFNWSLFAFPRAVRSRLLSFNLFRATLGEMYQFFI